MSTLTAKDVLNGPKIGTLRRPKSTGLLFCGEMVRGILEGRKTQTRRVVKPQPNWIAEVKHAAAGPGPLAWPIGSLGQQCGMPIKLAYGGPGDEIWVRETWQSCRNCGRINFKADTHDAGCICYEPLSPWKPGIHLFRIDARIRRTLTTVRVERLQDISEADAIAEGISYEHCEQTGTSPIDNYAQLWDSINAKKHPWSSNPWVFVLEWRNP